MSKGDWRMAFAAIVVFGIIWVVALAMMTSTAAVSGEVTEPGIIQSVDGESRQMADGVVDLTIHFYNHSGSYDIEIIDGTGAVDRRTVPPERTELTITYAGGRPLPIDIVARGYEGKVLGRARVTAGGGA